MGALTADVASGPLRDALTLLLGVVSGVLSGAFGVGGAIISTPGLRLLGVSAFGAVGTTLPPIIPAAAVGAARYSRAGLVEWGTVVAAAPAGMVAAVLGSFAAHAVPGGGHWLMVVTAVLLGLTAARMARTPTPVTVGPEAPPTTLPSHPSPMAAAAIGAAAGVLSGLLGVGGGLILVPAFSEVMGYPLKKAIATSLPCVGILAVPSTFAHALLGDVDWRIAALLTLAILPGARLGAAAAIAAKDRRLRMVVAVVLGMTALVYALGELSAF